MTDEIPLRRLSAPEGVTHVQHHSGTPPKFINEHPIDEPCALCDPQNYFRNLAIREQGSLKAKA